MLHPSDLLVNFETVAFPEASCTHQNSREPNVFDAAPSETYLVLLVSREGPSTGAARFVVATPYVFRSEEDLLYGWVDRWGNTYDHVERGIHGDRVRVVAWRRVDAAFDFRAIFYSAI